MNRQPRCDAGRTGQLPATNATIPRNARPPTRHHLTGSSLDTDSRQRLPEIFWEIDSSAQQSIICSRRNLRRLCQSRVQRENWVSATSVSGDMSPRAAPSFPDERSRKPDANAFRLIMRNQQRAHSRHSPRAAPRPAMTMQAWLQTMRDDPLRPVSPNSPATRRQRGDDSNRGRRGRPQEPRPIHRPSDSDRSGSSRGI